MGEKPPPEKRSGSNAEASFRLSAETRLSAIIVGRPDLVELIADLDPRLRPLREDEDRQQLAARLTLADVSRIAGIPLFALQGAITGEVPASCAKNYASAGGEPEAEPDWFIRFDETSAVRIDVCPMIAARRDPFTTVMAAVRALPREAGLIIEAPFDPRPLRRALEAKGFASFARRLGEGHWRIWFSRHQEAKESGQVGEVETARSGARIWTAEDGIHIDVRGLAAPAPLISILSLIDHGSHSGEIIVHHEREPVFLFPELAERGWTHAFIPGQPGEVRLVLRREKA